MGRFTDTACDFYEKLMELHRVQKSWSEATFGPAIERDARGPLDHLRKECLELAEVIGKPDHNTKELMSEVADLLILVNDVLWRTAIKWDSAVDAALEKMKENVNRTWPKYKPWSNEEPDRVHHNGIWQWQCFTHNDLHHVNGYGATPEAATADAYRQIRDKNACAVEHVRNPKEDAAQQMNANVKKALARAFWEKEVVPPPITRTGKPKTLKSLTTISTVGEYMKDEPPVKVDSDGRAELAFFVNGVEHKAVKSFPDESGRVRFDLEPIK